MNILVSGIAGDIGRGVARILKDLGIAERLIGCDIHSEHASHHYFDNCRVVPKATSPNYIESLRSISVENNLDAIILTSEAELREVLRFTRKGGEMSLPFVMANIEAQEVGFDKLKTAEFLSNNGCPFPWTKAVESGGPEEYPCILKKRKGAGSRGVYIIEDSRNSACLQSIYKEYIWQEYLPGNDNEYTCGVYGFKNGIIKTIIFRRRLGSGHTVYGEVIRHDEIESLCERIGMKLNLKGSINIQLRLTDRGPIVFEINPRFSSTVVFRHLLGFKDLLWSIDEQVLGKESSYESEYPVGAKVFRVTHERVEKNDKNSNNG